MPRLGNITDDMQQQTVGAFQFSSIRPDKLGGVEWTLVNVDFDISASIGGFEQRIVNCVKEALKACQKSPRSHNLVARVVGFGEDVHEVHGYMPLASLDLNSYKPLPLEGATALYDAAYSSIASAHQYAKDLYAMGMSVNCVTFVITDGLNNNSKMSTKDIHDELARARLEEKGSESHLTVLIGINLTQPNVKAELAKVHKECGFTQFIDAGDATEDNLAKLANFVSRSISSQSQSLGSGGPSQPLQI